jgi:hypothetical protein
MPYRSICQYLGDEAHPLGISIHILPRDRRHPHIVQHGRAQVQGNRTDPAEHLVYDRQVRMALTLDGLRRS